ncbi:hypothetical protein [Citrobacter rodentium]|nr:hypothetical protein [Citrobacter rodentium]KIQ51448.1 type III secretion protein [Citrobacter rodentium]QBY29428.1 type III secretion protein [Citrobacter rodentium]UHO33174.1 type III secretion protein [Citrobacter rodentium NBRC 105723 = DSM 16636]HAT8015392.1 type III secretion protein [Citrobacter rodentium NBRC 105723 = DSM 16636]HAT8020231.1 type III secretion protein [Citrobacter rodentium]
MARINSQIREIDGKLDDCEQAIKESIAAKQAYCASLVNLDKVSLYKYQIKNNAFDEQKQRLYEKKILISKEKSSLLESQKRIKENIQRVNKSIEKLSFALKEHYLD